MEVNNLYAAGKSQRDLSLKNLGEIILGQVN